MSAFYGNSRPTLHSLLMIAGMLIVSSLVVVSCGSGGSSGNGPMSCDVSVTSGDCDNDGVLNGEDEFPEDDTRSCTVSEANRLSETADCDNDTVANSVDNCPAFASLDQSDIDGDDEGDVCDSDNDNDTVANSADNCPTVVNLDQDNIDADAMGDACDVDDDNDGLIEIYNVAMLWAVHCDPDGTSYTAPMTAANGSVMLGGDGRPVCGTASTDGAADTATTDCTAETAPSSGIYLCGYELGASFDFPADWVPLPDRDLGTTGRGSFSGIFEGNGYELSNLNYMTPRTNDIGGLFDILETAGATIRNLRVSGLVRTTSNSVQLRRRGVIVGSGENGVLIAVSSAATFMHEGSQTIFIGGLVGRAGAGLAVYSSFASGRLQVSSSSANTGGLFGETANGSTVANSYVGDPADMSAALNGGPEVDQIGGILSLGGTTITNSYVSATIDGMAGTDNVGGLVGKLTSSVTSSYYDMGKLTIGSGDTENAGGTAVSAAQLTGCTQGAPIDADSPPAGGCGSLYTGWSDAIWDFGDAEQLPALKYSPISAVAGDECSPTTGVDADELAANFRPNAIAQPYCGKLLPGQGR